MTPLLNITIPVLNRHDLTLKTILTLHKTIRALKFVITVVDNGSDQTLRKRLVEFKKADIINNLFLLPCNMGISVACNIGWNLIDAPYYMKLDNDMEQAAKAVADLAEQSQVLQGLIREMKNQG